MQKTTIVSLYGGPGTGKSTSAAYLYYLLKSNDSNAELVREYVKDWAWEKRAISNFDQIYLLGKQVRRESLLYGKVDHIVTDSPVLLNVYYATRYCPASIADGIRASTLAFYKQGAEDGHRHVHVLLKRTKSYNPEGRYQNEDEAKEIDIDLKKMLDEMGFPYLECNTDEESLKGLLRSIRGT